MKNGDACDLDVSEKSKHEELKKAVEHKNFTRAAQHAAPLNLADSELKRIQYQAQYQMAETYQNAHGTKILQGRINGERKGSTVSF